MKPANPTLNDIQGSFEAISNQGRNFEINRENWAFFPGGHFQGIQFFHGAEPRLAISSSSSRNAYMVICRLDDFARQPAGEVINVTGLSGRPLKHAGGIQAIGKVFVVGVEDDEKQDRSQVQFLQLEDHNPIPQLIPHLTINREGSVRVSTAGAAGIVVDDRRYVLAVGSWDSATIDFYTAGPNAFDDQSESFAKFKTWTQSGADRSSWSDPDYLNYQSLNLVRSREAWGGFALCLLGFARSGGRDLVDLFRVDLEQEPPRMLVKKGRKHMIAGNGVNFSRGAGVSVDSPDRIRIFAVKGTSGSASGGGTIVCSVFD